MSDNIEILTPVGRLVQGDAFVGQDKDHSGADLVIKSGVNAGQPTVRYFVGIAIPKTDPGLPALQQQILQAAMQGFPTLFDAQGNCSNPRFAYKWVDGDSQVPNEKGRKPCEYEGFPGNLILRFNSGFAPKVWNTGATAILTDHASVKRGCFIRVAGTVRANGDLSKPGVYLNHSLIEFVAFGEEISSGPDGAAIFGGAPIAGALPAGASATPVAGAPLAVTPVAIPAAQPVVQPAPGFLQPPVGTVVTPVVTPAVGVPAVAAVVPVVAQGYLVDGVSRTLEVLQANGWTPEQIAAQPRG